MHYFISLTLTVLKSFLTHPPQNLKLLKCGMVLRLIVCTLLVYITFEKPQIVNGATRYDTLKTVKFAIKKNNIRIDSTNAVLLRLVPKAVSKIRDTITPSERSPEKVYLLQSQEKDYSDFYKYIITLGISTLALLLSYRNFKKDSNYKHLDFLTNIDKLLINDPSLWAVYDLNIEKYPADNQSQISQEELKGKLIAFCYYHLNNFEIVFNYPASRKSKKVWKDYMIHLIVSSTRFREILIKETKGFVYDQEYQAKMSQLLLVAQAILPYFKQYKDHSITKDQYYLEAKKIIKNNDKSWWN